MPLPRQTSLLERLARHPPQLKGGVEMTVGSERTVTFHHGDVHITFRAASLSVPYPSGLQRLMASRPDTELVISERIPAGLPAAAERIGVSYLDIAGHGHVVGPGLVYVAAPENAPAARRQTSPFTQKASRVVRALLSDRRRRWKLSDVAGLAASNPSNVHRVLSALIELGMVERDEDAYLVADPGSMLEAWSDQAQPPSERFVMRADGQLEERVAELVRQLDGAAVVSGELAAEELAPHLPAQSAIVHCLDPDSFHRLPRDSSRTGQNAGRPGREEILVDLADDGYGDFATQGGGLPIASPQQVYVDLARDRGRGREAAEHLRRTRLEF